MKSTYLARARFTSLMFALMALAVIGQMLRIQYSPEAAAFRQQGDRYSGAFRTFYPERGQIYDRHGFLLAGNQSVYEIGVNLQEMRNPHSIAVALNTTLGLDYDTVFTNLTAPPEGLLYLVLKDYVPADKAAVLRELKSQLNSQYQNAGDASLAGLDFRPHLQRVYPENELASNVLGFVTLEGRGYFGVEEKYNDLLAGVPVTIWVPENPSRAQELPRVPKGSDLVLTIDREVQAATEQILRDTLQETNAQAATIVVMNPKNGEILALVSSPQMNLNQFPDYPQIYHNASEFNRAIGMQYEPGSVMKILTMAAAIDSGIVAPGTTYLDTGFYEIGGSYVYNWDRGAWGVQDMIGCLANSLNVCMARLADIMGPDTFYTYMRRFGIGHPTGIDLAGESAGRLKVPGDLDWYNIDLGTNAFGQGVAVTPIQLMTAASALANDGKMVYPHLLYAMVTNGRQYDTPVQTLGTPISPQTARTVSDMLSLAMDRNQSLGRVDGYRLAGKTGTAQIPVDGIYQSDQINASFIGWGPLDDPQFMVYVWLERPEADWASYVATPVFHNVVEKLVVLLKVPPDSIRQQLVGQ